MGTPVKQLPAWLLAGLSCAIPHCALAWGTLLLIDPAPAQDTLSVGASVWSMPKSPEATHQSTTLTPALDYARHDGWFVSTEMGVGFNASHTETWQAGVRLWPQFGRSQQDVTPYAAHLGPRLQKQIFANHMLGDIAMVQSALSYGSGHDQRGMQSELGVVSGIPWSGGMLGLGVAATFGNRTYRRDYTGLNSSGWSDWSWTASLEHRFNANWHVDAQYQQASVKINPLLVSTGTHAHPQTLLLTLWRDIH